MADLSPITYGTVTGEFLALIADGVDGGVNPDVTPLSGTVTFTPSIKFGIYSGAGVTNPATLVPAPISVTLDGTGFLALNGVESVTLVATDDSHVNPTGWTYQASFALTLSGAPVVISPFSFSLPGGSTIDLSTVTPVPTAGGTFNVVGPAGPAGPTLFSPPDVGLVMAPGDPGYYVTSASLTGGYWYASMMKATASGVVSNLAIAVNAPPTSPTLAYMGLYDLGTSYNNTTATQVGVTANVNSALGTSGTRDFAMVAPVTLVLGHYYLIAVLCDVTFTCFAAGSAPATQNMRIVSGHMSSATGVGMRGLHSAAGSQTTLPGTITIASNSLANIQWCGAF